MDTEIRNYDPMAALNSLIQYKVNESAIAFSKRMILEGLAEENISKVEFYSEMWCRYSNRQLSGWADKAEQAQQAKPLCG